MKRGWVLGLLALLVLPCSAQQIMYSNLKELVEGRGDTVTILKVEKRSKNQIYLMGGADYRIEAKDNSGLCRYLKSRCYAVRMDTSLYVNCKKMRYKRYRFGGWYAPAMWVKGRIYFCAQPVGQAAASTATPPDATKLGGEVGDAINASGLVFARVYYELNPETGRSEFVGREKMLELLADYPALQEAFEKETHCVDLTESTIEANKRFFASADDVPKQAYTMGIKTIMQAKKILIVVNGENKADIVERAFFGPVTPEVPASILQLHNDVTLVGDEAALAKIGI